MEKQITTALQYSGGKDSRTILHMHKAHLDDILVTWVNTGASYPAVIKHMKELKAQVPHFLEIKTNQPAQIAAHGFPTDVIPLHLTDVGRACVKKPQGYTTVRLQSTFNCCAKNLWLPMQEAMKRRGITTIIRGQRQAEQYTAPFTDGHIEDGVTYLLPIEGWTDEQVFAYLKANNVPIPDYYLNGEGTSHDCWNCTGYLDTDQGRISNLPETQRLEVVDRLVKIKAAIWQELRPLEVLLAQADCE